MNICINKNGKILHISVNGELEYEKDKEAWFNILDPKVYAEMHITFLNANLLPVDVIESVAYLQKVRRVRVYVLKKYLYSYLLSLGIQCIYTEKWALGKRTGGCEDKAVNERSDLHRAEIYDFLQEIKEQYGYDYTQYQIDSIERRIKVNMLKQNISDFGLLRGSILRSEEMFEALFLDFSINTTQFFRDPEVFGAMKHKIFPYLDSYAHIKVWCGGCSTGQEPYSLAILLDECGMLHKTQIYATDINPYVIGEAKNGLFPIDQLEEGIKNYQRSTGEKSFIEYFELRENYIKIKDEFKRNILFFQHSLMESGILNEFQLIVCRNVLIYFDVNLQRKVLGYFHRSLDRNGFLVLGKSEGMLQNRGTAYFQQFDESMKMYKKREIG